MNKIFEIKPCNFTKIEPQKYKSDMNIKLFDFQRANVEWMQNLENKIKSKKDGHVIRFLDKTPAAMRNECCNGSINIRGGVLCDEAGMGKGYCMLSLIINNDSKLNLIVAPKRLIPDWICQINKLVGKKKSTGKKRLTHTQITNTEELENINLIDFYTNIVFVTPQIFLNYDKKLKNIFWNRIIIDEFNQIFKSMNKTILMSYKSNIKWLMSETPLYCDRNINSTAHFFLILQFLCGDKYTKKELNYIEKISIDNINKTNIIQSVIKQLFRCNTRASTR